MVVSIAEVSQEVIQKEKGQIMPLSQEFIIDRAKWTVTVQRNIADTWVWSVKTVAQWEAELVTCEERRNALVQARTLYLSLMGKLDGMMERLHQVTLVYLTVLKSLQCDNEANRELLEVLTASGGSRNSILDEATDLQTAWAEIDPTWEPKPGVTLAAFILQIKECAETKTEFTKANTAWRSRASELRVFLEKLNRYCVAWYAAATAVFPEDTVEGEVIRSMVPTTTVTPPPPAPVELAA